MAKRVTVDDTREMTDEEIEAEKADKAAEKRFGDLQAIIKDSHLLAKELVSRLATCRMQTTPPEAIGHDLERVQEILAELKKGTTRAKRLCS